MCSVCGCSNGEAHIEQSLSNAPHGAKRGHGHAELHHHHHHHHEHIPEGQKGGRRLIQLEQDILAKNNEFAAANRARLMEKGCLALNLVSSPGSGKTALLVKTIEMMHGQRNCCVIEGDQQTSADAERIRGAGAPAIQINTGKGCHLDGHMVGHALDKLNPDDGAIVFIENVGNLVCPAPFDLGENHKVVIFSITEGEDKPLKYPDIFAASDLMLLNKIDLAPHVDFDIDAAIANARKVNPRIGVLNVSARTGNGMQAWLDWIEAAKNFSALSNPAIIAR